METIYDVLRFIINSLRGSAIEADIAKALAIIEAADKPPAPAPVPVPQPVPGQDGTPGGF
jgi:hypothetical protein